MKGPLCRLSLYLLLESLKLLYLVPNASETKISAKVRLFVFQFGFVTSYTKFLDSLYKGYKIYPLVPVYSDININIAFLNIAH